MREAAAGRGGTYNPHEGPIYGGEEGGKRISSPKSPTGQIRLTRAAGAVVFGVRLYIILFCVTVL